MKILIVRGNPRKSGFTQYLTNLFAAGAREAGAEVAELDLAQTRLEPCTGCYHCWLVEPGVCIHDDPMAAQFAAILEADMLVCATPVYYFAMSGLMKTFFERTFPLTSEGIEFSSLGMLRNRLREPDKWEGKKFISLAVGALRAPEAYEPLNQTFRLIADTLEMELAGQITRPESHMLPYRLSKPLTVKRIEAAFQRAGREAAQSGHLSEEIMREAALPLTPDDEYFRTYSNIFWRHAAETDAASSNSPRLHQRVGKDPDILMREMARCVNPRTTQRVKATLQFEFPDLQRHYRFTIDRGSCALDFDPASDPDLRVTCTADIWAGVFLQQIDVPAAIRQGVLRLEGDKSLFSRLSWYFPAPTV